MSSLLFNVLFAWKCANTHHKMALDALNRIDSETGARWRDLCLKNIERYLDGAKAPDNAFKDFRNHVLHVRENNWGGALGAARQWYTATVEALRNRRWNDAVYSAGVLSHYYTDPLHPFHTGQSEAECIVHRAFEWSISCAYDELRTILETDLGGWPGVEVPDGADWLESMILSGARTANQHYEACLDHYDFKKGVKDPPAGLDQELKDRVASLIGQAVSGYARVMDRAFLESQAELPVTSVTLLGVMAQLTVPLFWVTRKLKDARDRAAVEATFKEFQATGKVIDTLSADDASIRESHATEVLKKPLEVLDAEAPAPIGAAHGIGAPARPASKPLPPQAAPGPKAAAKTTPQPDSVTKSAMPSKAEPATQSASSATASSSVRVTPASSATAAGPRFYLSAEMPVEKAPSIGAKTSALLEKHHIATVGDLLAADPASLAGQLNDRHLDARTLGIWQIQARLCCTVPELRGHDAQILVACGITSAVELAAASPEALLVKVEAFVATPAGDRILRGGQKPDLAEVTAWVEQARPRHRAAA